jgi:hypothetical protein
VTQKELEQQTPWSVCGFIHLAQFAQMTSCEDAALSYYSIAISQCHYLGINRDLDLTWDNPTGNSLTLKQFQRALYLNLYMLDLDMSINHERPPKIVDPISYYVIKDFSLPNSPSEATK